MSTLARVVALYRGNGRSGPTRVGRWLSLPMVGGILLYRFTLSAVMGRQCRFEPTCSRYGLDAYRTHGVVRGSALTAARIFRCQPIATSGYDPVPQWGEPRSPTSQADRAALKDARYRDEMRAQGASPTQEHRVGEQRKE